MEEAKHSKIEILQRKIKRMLEENPKEGDLLMIESDAMKFIHEIEVQQLELEMENEELIRAREQGIIAAWKSDELYDFAPSGYFTLSPQGIIKELNLNGANLLGKERANLINSTFGFFVSDDTRKDFNYFLYEIFTGKGKKICDVTLTDQGSEPIYVSLSGISDPKGEQCFITATDITDRKRMEDKLLISEEKYKTIFEQSVVGNLMTSVTDGKMKVNKACCEMLGYSEAELSSLSWQTITNPDDLERDQKIVSSLISGEIITAHWEKRYIHKNGNTVWVDISTRLIYDKENNPLFFNTSLIDITGRKLAEQELLFANKELAHQNREKEKRADELVIANKELLHQNDEKEKRAAELFIANKELDFQNKEKENRAAELIVANKELDFQNREKEKRADELVIANKELLYQNDLKEKRAAELFLANKELDFQNTEKEKRAAELVIAKDQAEQSDRLKSAFLANMSHEIRTPMNGILGFAQLLKEPNLSSEKQIHFLRIIERSGERMLNIINDIVDISKIESHQMEVSISETNINEKIEYLHTFFKPEMDKKSIEFSFKNGLPEKRASIMTDSEKIYAILTNLVKNAIKFCDKGTIEIGYDLVETPTLVETQCLTSLQKPTMSLQFYVKDTGIGIPKDRQEAIFDRFIQVDLVDKMARQGAGLGLSISKAYVEMLGGKIWVESEVGKGSTFYFTLPYQTELEEAENTNIVSVEEAETLLRKLKILIAEDDEVSEMLLETDVEKYSHKVFKAKTGFEAIEVCQSNPDIDLVLMDIRMPGMDGYEATRQIRQFNKDVVIIAQTAYALVGDREKALKVGCSDYISKPIRKDKLAEVMKKYF